MQKGAPLFMDIGQGLSLMIGLLAISAWETKDRPHGAKRGTIGFNSDTKNLEYWDGSSWYVAPMSAI